MSSDQPETATSEFRAASEAMLWALHPVQDEVVREAFEVAVDRFPADRLHALVAAATRLAEAAQQRGLRYATPQPAGDGRCSNCERCRWDPERDCGKAEHPHCDHCGHCLGRHSSHALPDDGPQ